MTARRPFRSALIAAVLGSGFAVALGAAFAAPLAAQERDSIAAIPVPPIVVTVSRIETPTDEVANAITVVTRQEIERRQLRTVEEALRTVPGVSLVRSGGPGGTTTIFIRGASSEHALVLLDGIELNDPSLPAGGYDFATLGTAGVERIEILRGPQSTVHGSNALGGVVNIITGPPRHPGLNGRARMEYRSLNGVFEFSHVSRPPVASQNGDGFSRHSRNRFRFGGTVGLHKMLGKERHVFHAIPQGRDMYCHHIQSVIKVLAKRSSLHECTEVFFRRGNNAHIDGRGHGTADASEFFLLNDA